MSTFDAEAAPDRRLICAHNGAPNAFPENSMAGFEVALASGVDLIEADLRATARGELVLSHGPVDPAAERPVRFADLLELARGRIGLIVDLKEPHLAERLLAAVADWPGRLIVASVTPAVLADLRRRGPSVRTGLVVAPPVTVHPVRAAVTVGATAVLWADELATPTALRACAEAELGAWVWTINAPFRLAERLADPGLEGVITDVPSLAASLRPPDPAGFPV